MLSQQYKGYLTVVAGFMIMVFNGSSNMVGNIAPYILSYYPKCTVIDS